MIKGKRLTTRAPSLGLVSVSAPEAVWRPEIYARGKAALESRGIKTIESPTVRSKYLYLSDTPRKIAGALLAMFQNGGADAVMCVGGGNCMNKVLPFTDMAAIAQNYKPFVGSSDITALLLAMLNAGITAFHGPDAMWGYGAGGTPTDYTHNNWLDVMQGFTGKFPARSEWRVFRRGEASGRSIGGNITTIQNVVGTKFCPLGLFDGTILFLEDVGEEYPSLDSKLTYLRLLGVFDRINGVVLGKLAGCAPPGNEDISVTEFLESAFGGYSFPVIYDCDFGHVPDSLCIPFGCGVKMSALGTPAVSLLEKGVV